MISFLQLGLLDYATGLQLQKRLVDLRKEGRIGNVLLLLEHEPVITLGRNAKAKNILASPELLARRGIEVFECNRGGDVTFHGPGQIVGYPIFDLREISSSEGKRKTLGAVEYVRRLEEVLIRTCADFKISTRRICGLTGVWTNRETHDSGRADMPPREEANREGHDFSRAEMRTKQPPASAAEVTDSKIAAIGVHISRAVTSHGFALNVTADLSCFDLIVPCGIESRPVTSMQKELGFAPALQEVAHSISRNFGVVFSSQMLWLENLDQLLGRRLGVPMQPPATLKKLHGEEDSTWA